MSDINTESAYAQDEDQGVVTPESGDAAKVPVPEVTAQEAKTVGDENLPDPREPQVETVQDQVDAQVVQEREGAADKVNVHEVSVTLDEVITDTADPLAVQVPDAGRSPLLTSGLPIAGLDAERPEDVFARDGRADES